ncbi:MAG TPA: energy-coupling factor ABC transporter permease [Anaerolineaceae bacterium]|jgi:cobalt/nickel transport system permease protein|nr:cobalamin biosynthesis protein CbiM [Chloroflexota bacterium]HNS07599.1 energy-coupling factor ABC transporter permease [Anaerolineaceae bacterium]HOE02100.1 energy-coupling factor ABC transporter permease [Anaerolineaceae bacterium]HUM62285.1 energy-coupling factor ABC transporter permease [Anaerolineaceae bacterium]
MLFSPINPMHIPDGFLSVLLSIVLWVISVVLIGIALRKTGQTIGERQVPLMGVLAAAIFAGQMLNFSVTGGTSGHLLGAAIAAILLGPWPAVLVMTSVVAVQALLFQDGGILALGANLFNMAIIGPFVAYALFTLLMKLFKKQTWGLFVAGFVAAWSSIFIASLACALQLALSGTSPANIAVPAMGAIHALIGIGEGLITIGALAFIFAARKDLLKADANKPARNIGVVVGGLLISLVLVVLSPLASSHPDGLEWVAEKHGFIEAAREAFYNIVPDYSMPGISNPALATIVAGILGAVIVFGVAYGIARAEKRPSAQDDAQR